MFAKLARPLKNPKIPSNELLNTVPERQKIKNPGKRTDSSALTLQPFLDFIGLSGNSASYDSGHVPDPPNYRPGLDIGAGTDFLPADDALNRKSTT